MATISYKCDTCKREIELIENSQGFTTFGRCVITDGCIGKLYKTERNPNNVRESPPLFIGGLDNYFPRKAFHQFNQGLAADRWTVEHNLGTSPAIFVYEITDNGETIPIDNTSYSVSNIDKNTVLITFQRKLKGVVHAVARSTVPDVPPTINVPAEMVQASVRGIITFAIPKYLTQIRGTSNTPEPSADLPISLCNSDKLRLEIEISRPNEQPLVCFEEIPFVIDGRSPWTGWNEVLVRKRRSYCIRTSEILAWKIFGGIDLKKEDIPNGTRIRFLRIEYENNNRYLKIPSRALLMLLSNEPHEYADKIKDRLIDVGELIGDNPDYFVYENGEIYLEGTKVEKTYPDIARMIVMPPSPTPSPTPSLSVSGTPAVTPTVTPTVTMTITP